MQRITFTFHPANPADYLPFPPPQHPERNIERVNRGIALIDQKYPHWWRVLDLETLDLRSTKNCVLGQVAGDYLDGLVTMFGGDGDYVQYQMAVNHGFDTNTWSDAAQVEALWKQAAGERQAKLLENKEEAHA
jgi:hypothetical protein